MKTEEKKELYEFAELYGLLGREDQKLVCTAMRVLLARQNMYDVQNPPDTRSSSVQNEEKGKK